MLYRLEVQYCEDDTLDLYLEGGDESPSAEQWTDTLEMLAEVNVKQSRNIKDAIKVLKNLGAPDEEDYGWQEYFPYLRCPHLHGQAIQCRAQSTHPDHPGLGEMMVTLTWVKVFKPYLKGLRELYDDLAFLKREDKKELAKFLRGK